MKQTIVTVLHLEAQDDVPNNPRLPVLLYEAGFQPAADDLASRMEKCFANNGWPAQWRNGIYDFHHYHSLGHEVLGIAAGSAEILLGGRNGRRVAVKAGDVLLLPAGTGHCRLEASHDFLVVGAYPPGQEADILQEPASTIVKQAIARLGFPPKDPVRGEDGPLSRHWSDPL